MNALILFVVLVILGIAAYVFISNGNTKGKDSMACIDLSGRYQYNGGGHEDNIVYSRTSNQTDYYTVIGGNGGVLTGSISAGCKDFVMTMDDQSITFKLGKSGGDKITLTSKGGVTLTRV